MNEQQRPLLLFPQPTASEREKRPPGRARLHLPSAQRQIERIGPKFGALQDAFNAKRIQLQATVPNDEPEMVVVFETVGRIEDFVKAVRKISGMEWLLDADEDDIEHDDDFYDEQNRDKPLTGRIYLLGSNQQALNQVVSLWNRHQENPRVQLERGLAAWKNVFKHLRDVRFWGAQDRIRPDARQYLQERLQDGDTTIRFEVEAWCYSSVAKNESAKAELTQLVGELGGRILQSALLENIVYHGFLVELPAQCVRSLLSDAPPALVLSERVMFFRPRGQALSTPSEDETRLAGITTPAQMPSGQPVVALLDGLPLQNHPLLAGRLSIDDPDGWDAGYPAAERNHGTAMASLLLHGELDAPGTPLARPVYARPIMRPDASDTFHNPRRETTPNDTLLIDLVHRAVRRMFESEGGSPAAAPAVKAINLSVGDAAQSFDGALSPWARLLDWLAARYQVLFVVSAGNVPAQLALPVPRSTLVTLTTEQCQQLALPALFAGSTNRSLLAPAESINAITVGAVHADSSILTQTAGRFDLFPAQGVSPYSAIGHGFKRAIKPDILLPGGRVLYRESFGASNAALTNLDIIHAAAAPGHRVAAPEVGGQDTKYARGTSNATALATRGAAQAHAVVEALREGHPQQLSDRFDAALLKALLVHGVGWNTLENQILNARPEVTDWRQKQRLVTRFIGYGLADMERAITCTEQRATLIGVGELQDGHALEFRVPLPPSLNAQVVQRRLTLTLAYMSPVNPRSARYRAARLWVNPPAGDFNVSRMSYDWRQVTRGTVQHEVLEGEAALAFTDGAELAFKVNCAEDAGKITAPVPFALCVTLEVGEEVNLPIYQEIRERVTPRVGVAAA
jgi:hypothetical protein